MKNKIWVTNCLNKINQLEALESVLKHIDIKSGGYGIQSKVKRAIAKARGES